MAAPSPSLQIGPTPLGILGKLTGVNRHPQRWMLRSDREDMSTIWRIFFLGENETRL